MSRVRFCLPFDIQCPFCKHICPKGKKTNCTKIQKNSSTHNYFLLHWDCTKCKGLLSFKSEAQGESTGV
ncbi:hypothetical protein NEAUS03_2241 [Nematocida ausubeli]|nr:hypothetical protein NEAUS03_2241 [Nematocida ausubeli]